MFSAESLYCGVLSSLATILPRGREFVENFYYAVTDCVLCLFPSVPWVGLQSVI